MDSSCQIVSWHRAYIERAIEEQIEKRRTARKKPPNLVQSEERPDELIYQSPDGDVYLRIEDSPQDEGKEISDVIVMAVMVTDCCP